MTEKLSFPAEAAAYGQGFKPETPAPTPAPVPHVKGSDSLKNALEMTGCESEEDLIDMANVGNSLMERIDSLVSMPGPYHHWSPADDPAEIVFDLVNDLDELREGIQEAIELLMETRQVSPARSAGHNARLRLQAALGTLVTEVSE